MSTLELKKELHQIIDNSDTNLVEDFYTIITAYLDKSKNSQMIAESEEDIKLGKIHSQKEVRKIIESWTE
jgi:ADP-dependent phosphofructokinase/glucokinase